VGGRGWFYGLKVGKGLDITKAWRGRRTNSLLKGLGKEKSHYLIASPTSCTYIRGGERSHTSANCCVTRMKGKVKGKARDG